MMVLLLAEDLFSGDTSGKWSPSTSASAEEPPVDTDVPHAYKPTLSLFSLSLSEPLSSLPWVSLGGVDGKCWSVCP